MKEIRKNEPANSVGMLYAKNLLVALFISGILLILSALLLYMTDVSATIISVCMVCTYVLSNFVGGWRMGKGTGEKKFLWGLLLGLGYFLFLFLVSYIGNQFFLGDQSKTILIFFLCTFSGMFGGMLS